MSANPHSIFIYLIYIHGDIHSMFSACVRIWFSPSLLDEDRHREGLPWICVYAQWHNLHLLWTPLFLCIFLCSPFCKSVFKVQTQNWAEDFKTVPLPKLWGDSASIFSILQPLLAIDDSNTSQEKVYLLILNSWPIKSPAWSVPKVPKNNFSCSQVTSGWVPWLSCYDSFLPCQSLE